MITVITGGSGSGKSAYAEKIVTDFGDLERIYIATMFPFDEESHQRIARHRQMRAEKKVLYHRVLYRIEKSENSTQKLRASGMYVKPDG